MSRTIIITGASGKFGRVLVEKFLEEGDSVIAIGGTKKKLEQLKSYNKNKLQHLYIICTDLMKDDSIENVIKVIKDLGLEPDSLINNARNLKHTQLDEKGRASSKNFLDEFKLGVVVPYQFTMLLVDTFKSSFKNVVNISSIYGSVAANLKLYENPLNESAIQYGVAKSALQHLTKELSVRLAKNSVRVNCAAFGGVEGRVSEAFKKRYSELCPSGRMLSKDEIFGPIDMLLSEKTSGMNGHVMMIDGGWTIW
jgi:NAD(P)-dependent dehydrogenase (short-subunit alcohol dehydrogenase family)